MSGITGKTGVLGVIGWPVAHSRSPQMQAAAIAAAGLDLAYVALPVEPARVGDAVRGLRALGFRGCNVTIPHKVAVIEYLDELTPAARGIGAVNTIEVRSDGRLVGHNTDADGGLAAVAFETGADAGGADVLVLGAGGAARAVAWGAAARGARRVTFVNRTRGKADALVADLATAHPRTDFRVLESPVAADLATVGIVFQMTSLGMKPDDPLPLDPALLPAGAAGLEAVYSPLETPWLRACRARGLRIADGLTMLVGQGALAFEIWTGQTADREAMRRALVT
ncbi:MAG: shikimate dehydrogenase [Candidatus Sumerlaeia bacterium]|nr:shikimate dehydrogenase [Candidatus Sumerlaeia bacterium]